MASNKVNISLPMPNIEVKINGQWQKAISLCDGLQSSIRKGYDKGSNRFSKKLILIVRRAIRSGTPPQGGGVLWPPLSEKTLKKHGSHKKTIKKQGSHNIYHLTGLYMRSIGIQKSGKRTWIGIPRGIKPSNTHARKTLNQVAIILEYGSRNGKIPSRPLWKPAFKAANKSNQLKKDIMWGIRSQLFLDHGINPKQVR